MAKTYISEKDGLLLNVSEIAKVEIVQHGFLRVHIVGLDDEPLYCLMITLKNGKSFSTERPTSYKHAFEVMFRIGGIIADGENA